MMKTTNQEILLRACVLFSEKGYTDVTMRDLAESLHVVPSALYRHYPNKHQIFQEILKEMERYERKFIERCELPLKPYTEAEEEYENITDEMLLSFLLEVFRFWTEECFPAAFRRMLTHEQYCSHEMQVTYQFYFGTGPIQYLSDIFKSRGLYMCELRALRLWGPVVLLINQSEENSRKHKQYKEYLEKLLTENLKRS